MKKLDLSHLNQLSCDNIIKELEIWKDNLDLIDSHVHLHSIHDSKIRNHIIQSSLNNGISYLCENSTKEDNFDIVLNLKSEFPKQIVAGLGIHPYYFESASKNYIEVSLNYFIIIIII